MFSGSSRRWIYGGTAIYLAILVVVVAGLLLLYRGARDRLDQSLGERLSAIALTTTQLVDASRIETWSVDPEEPIDLLWLTTRLEEIRRSNDLAELSLCDTRSFVLVSASNRIARGELNTFWDLSRTSVDLALAGFTAASHLYRSGALHQQSAHAPVFDSDGEVVAVVSADAAVDFFDTLDTLRDGAITTGGIVVAFLLVSGLAIARLLRAQEQYRAAMVRQEELAAMGRMTAGIAHEIRNPLGVIRGTGQHLKRRLAEAGIDDPMADFIPEEVDRLDRILGGYLAFGSGHDLAHELLDLAEVVDRTVRLMENELVADGIKIVSSASELMIRGDRQRLQQVLMNLILNARDAMDGGGMVEIAGGSEISGAARASRSSPPSTRARKRAAAWAWPSRARLSRRTAARSHCDRARIVQGP